MRNLPPEVEWDSGSLESGDDAFWSYRATRRLRGGMACSDQNNLPDSLTLGAMYPDFQRCHIDPTQVLPRDSGRGTRGRVCVPNRHSRPEERRKGDAHEPQVAPAVADATGDELLPAARTGQAAKSGSASGEGGSCHVRDRTDARLQRPQQFRTCSPEVDRTVPEAVACKPSARTPTGHPEPRILTSHAGRVRPQRVGCSGLSSVGDTASGLV